MKRIQLLTQMLLLMMVASFVPVLLLTIMQLSVSFVRLIVTPLWQWELKYQKVQKFRAAQYLNRLDEKRNSLVKFLLRRV